MDANIVAVQEIEVNSVHQQTRLWSTTHKDNQVDLLSKSTELKYTAFAPAITCVATGSVTRGSEKINVEESKGGRFGIAILSSMPILQQKILTFQPYGSPSFKTKRNAVAVLVRFGTGNFWFVCTHLGCHSGGEQAQQVVELAKWINDELNADGTPVILAGDFNSPRFFKSMRTLRNSNLIDCTTSEATFPAVWWRWTWGPALLKLDYIYTTENVECLGYLVLKHGASKGGCNKGQCDLMGSDHRPILASFKYEGSSSKNTSR